MNYILVYYKIIISYYLILLYLLQTLGVWRQAYYTRYLLYNMLLTVIYCMAGNLILQVTCNSGQINYS